MSNYARLMDYRVEFNFDLEDGTEEKVIISIGNSQFQTDCRPELMVWLVHDHFVRAVAAHEHVATDWFFKPRVHYMEL